METTKKRIQRDYNNLMSGFINNPLFNKETNFGHKYFEEYSVYSKDVESKSVTTNEILLCQHGVKY